MHQEGEPDWNDLNVFLINAKSLNSFSDCLLPCPSCGSTRTKEEDGEIGVNLQDQARLCFSCASKLRLELGIFLDLHQKIEVVVQKSSESLHDCNCRQCSNESHDLQPRYQVRNRSVVTRHHMHA